MRTRMGSLGLIAGLCAFVALTGQRVQAGIVDISTNTIINASNSFPSDSVRVSGVATLVDIVPGGFVGLNVIVLDSSMVNVSGGSVGGSVVSGNTAMIDFSSGSAGGLRASGDSVIHYSGGAVAGDIFSDVDATVNVSGGSGERLRLTGGTINWTGGTISGPGTDIRIEHPSSILNIFGSGLTILTFGPGAFVLNGFLEDGTSVTNAVGQLFGTSTELSQVVLHNSAVPEPATLILLAFWVLGALGVRHCSRRCR